MLCVALATITGSELALKDATNPKISQERFGACADVVKENCFDTEIDESIKFVLCLQNNDGKSLLANGRADSSLKETFSPSCQPSSASTINTSTNSEKLCWRLLMQSLKATGKCIDSLPWATLENFKQCGLDVLNSCSNTDIDEFLAFADCIVEPIKRHARTLNKFPQA